MPGEAVASPICGISQAQVRQASARSGVALTGSIFGQERSASTDRTCACVLHC